MNQRNPRNSDIFWGLLLILFINIVVMIFLWTATISPYYYHHKKSIGVQKTTDYMSLALLIDFGQLIYILPLTFRQNGEFKKGVIMGAVITVLINFGGCFLFLTMR